MTGMSRGEEEEEEEEEKKKKKLDLHVAATRVPCVEQCHVLLQSINKVNNVKHCNITCDQPSV